MTDSRENTGPTAQGEPRKKGRKNQDIKIIFYRYFFIFRAKQAGKNVFNIISVLARVIIALKHFLSGASDFFPLLFMLQIIFYLFDHIIQIFKNCIMNAFFCAQRS